MPLSAASNRELVHTRRYEFQGFRRDDGLWDVEGRMTDVRAYGFDNEYRGHIPAGEPIHDMRVRLTLDDEMVIKAIEVATDAAPFQICPAILPNFQAVVGLKIGPGWNRKIKELLGGARGCTHHVEMLGAIATAAFQTIYPARSRYGYPSPPSGPGTKPPLIDSCHAFASDGDIVKRRWPDFFTSD